MHESLPANPATALELRREMNQQKSIGLFRTALMAVVLFLSLLRPGTSQAQRLTLSGTISDAETGEVLIGATILAVAFNKGAAANRYGFYSLTLPRADSISVLFSYVGYVPALKKVYLTSNIVLDVRLVRRAEALDEITVTADRVSDDNVAQTRMGVVDVPIRAVERLPAILGEADVLKVIQLLPGVQAGEEGTTGFHVRGGAADQNLVQLDEATVYNPNHLFGLFSTFNTAALNNVELITGGFPAYYGGRLSSMLEITMREGNQRRREVQGGIGLLSSQLTVEGPIQKDRASYIVSGRRSYFDILAKPFVKAKTNNRNTYYLYDVNAKVNYRFSPRDRAYLSFFAGRDNADFVSSSSLGYGIRFGNSTATARWNHIFGPRLFANTSVIRNDYFIRVNSVISDYYSQNYSGIADLTAKTELQYFPAPGHQIRIGGVATRHSFRSTGNEGVSARGETAPPIDRSAIPSRQSTEVAGYVNDEWAITERLGLNIGIRVPFFSSKDTSYSALEPRISAKVGLSDASSVKASYTVMNQFVHLIPSSAASIPADIWALSSARIRPQLARQVALGYFQNLRANEYEASLEVYYKEMDRQVLFREGAQLLAYSDIENQVTFGRGWSYGAELLFRRRVGRLSGWVSYTLSRTDQRFAALNQGRAFPFKYDRRHNLAVAVTYEINGRWTLSGDFVFRSGSAYTLPAGRFYASQGGALYQGIYFDYDRINSYRLKPHHRLDLSAEYKFTRHRWVKESSLVFGAYNIYSHLNPYFVYVATDTKSGLPESRQITLLPIVPSVSFQFKF